jgi:type II secretory ATPase GspE/PulE/Tfp pilus assembly ATPase PilB-like protein
MLEKDLLKKALLNVNYITEDKLKEAEKFAEEGELNLKEAIIYKNLLNRELIGKGIAEYYKVPYADLADYPPAKKQVFEIPANTAQKYRVILFKHSQKSVTIATDDPAQKKLKSVIKKHFSGKKIEIAYSLPEDIDSILLFYRAPFKERLEKIFKKEGRAAPKVLDEIIKEALAHRASDIHLEPKKNTVSIRLRIDGILQDKDNIPQEYYENILNLIKIKGHLRTDEHYAPQDGSIRHETGDKVIDLRVSIVPTLGGEKIVIRILSQYIRSFALKDIGASKEHQKKIERASASPFGMILVTGPTGSGKTTTLYSLIKNINTSEVNISTIEDPVEYNIPGVNHIQVNPKTDLTFAKGLRSIIRQDPDIILVGEIRDEETVEISINAALTGHLLFSTFHSNNAASAIPRLLEMSAEPFLLASTMELIVAQRLVRQVCEKCRHSYTVPFADIKKDIPNAKEYFKSGKNVTLFKGKGCENCNHTGYKGRTAIFEMIEVNKEMEELIVKNPSAGEIWEVAKKQGSKSMFEDGIKKVSRGITTLEEVKRVSRELH